MDELAAPPEVRTQVRVLADGLADVLGDRLLGLYLHGSLALGGFRADRSDIDFLAVVAGPLRTAERRGIVGLLLDESREPCPIEGSVLHRGQLAPWRYPTPFELNYGEVHRVDLEMAMLGGDPTIGGAPGAMDPDVAAHVAVTRARGIRLLGADAAELLPQIPADHYVASILEDSLWARQRAVESPVYAVLNHCRVLRHLHDGSITSKVEGGTWGVSHFPEPHRSLIATTLAAYRGEVPEGRIDGPAVEAFLAACDASFEQRLGTDVRGWLIARAS